jgi:hypothetical protein
MPPDKAMIAVVTKQSANFSANVVMVDGEISRELVFVTQTHGALVVLPLQHFIVLFQCDAVGPHQMRRAGFRH